MMQVPNTQNDEPEGEIPSKVFDLILKLTIDMVNESAEIEKTVVEQREGQMPFRDKVLTYFRNEVKTRREEWEGFKTPIADTELSQAFIAQRTIAETKYWQAVSYLQYLEIL